VPAVSEPEKGGPSAVVLDHPSLADGAALWRIARDSRALDLNSSYSYLLWCRDFARTSVVARSSEGACGFVTGYLRPDAPDTLMVWQVAVDASRRGEGLARRMLDHVVDHAPERPRWLETTITADNAASIALFGAFAHARRAQVHSESLLAAPLFPDGHDAEVLYRIGPLGG
jgi:diaminobutyrate acetyltransferase